jgi:YVTN family beta-propeller protein
MSLATDLSNGRVYCTNVNARKVDVIDARADTVIKTIPLGRSPGTICWNRTSSRVYITDFMDNVVYIVRDTSTALSERPRDVELSRWPRATVTRNALDWPWRENGVLLDICGREVAQLRPGRNDLRALAPGIYTVLGGERPTQEADEAQVARRTRPRQEAGRTKRTGGKYVRNKGLGCAAGLGSTRPWLSMGQSL